MEIKNIIKEALDKEIKRFLKEETVQCMSQKEFDIYRSQDEDELMEYVYLSKERTGLPMDCFADDDGSFKLHNHPLWFYVTNGYEPSLDVLPFSVSDSPEIMISNPALHLSDNDISQVKEFIIANKHMIVDLANGQLKNTEFLKHIYCFSMAESTTHKKPLITEMSKLHPTETGLPIDIWVDEGGTYRLGGHAPRIKIPSDRGITSSSSYASVTIEDEPRLLHKTNLPNKIINQVKDFVLSNKANLLLLSNQAMSLDDFKSHIIKVE